MDNAAQVNESLRKACIICQKEYSGELSTCPIDNIALTVLEVPRDPLVGTLFCDRFQITEVLGGGGMGMVYRATHLLMQRSVAIKILHTKMIGNADALKRFKVEAHAASNFSHPNILNVHDFGVSNQGQPYMVMDYLDGINLTALLDAEKHIPVTRAINMFLQMSSALAHAHSKEIIHRDVKPSNIMLVEFEGRREFVKLVDFGIAKVLNPSTPEAENLTRTGEVFGSPLYMSPEQCQGKKLDSRADIYSLGAVMYRVVSGKPIFESTDALETMFRQVSEMPASFAKVCPELQIPEKLESVIFKCLAKDREQRYQSMLELKDDLELTLAEIKAQSKTTLPMNTLPFESERIAAKDLNSDGWLTDLSENTGALPIAKTVITNQLTNQHEGALAASNPTSPGVQNTVPVSPFADVVSSAAAGSPNTSSAQPVQPSVANVSTGSNNYSFSLNSNTGPSVAGATNPSQSSPAPAKATAIDKRDETISIVVNKKSVAIGSAALAVLLALAGFFYFRPSGTSSNLSPKNVPDSQFSSITPTPTIDGAHLPAPIPAPAQTVAKKSTPSSKKSASYKKATAKNKPQHQKWKNYYPSASGRGSSYSGSNYSSPGNNPYSSSSSYSSSRSSSSYNYQSPVSQPVIQSAPVMAPVASPIQQSSVSSSSYSSSSESYVNRQANRYGGRYAEKGVDRVTGIINRNLTRGINKGAGFLRRLTR